MTAANDRFALEVQAARDRGEPPPCADRLEWLSEDAEERELAAWQCGKCALIELCAAAADAIDARFGVWAGVDRGRKARKK